VTTRTHGARGPAGHRQTSSRASSPKSCSGWARLPLPTSWRGTEEDLVVGYVSQTAQRMKESAKPIRWGVFIDEAYRLVRTRGHSFGRTLNNTAEVHGGLRDKLVVIVAATRLRCGIPAANRVWRRGVIHLTFESYSPEEIVAIARTSRRQGEDRHRRGGLDTEAASAAVASLPNRVRPGAGMSRAGRLCAQGCYSLQERTSRRLHVMAPAELSNWRSPTRRCWWSLLTTARDTGSG